MFIFAITYVYFDIESILAMQKWIKKNGNDLGMGKLCTLKTGRSEVESCSSACCKRCIKTDPALFAEYMAMGRPFEPTVFGNLVVAAKC